MTAEPTRTEPAARRLTPPPAPAASPDPCCGARFRPTSGGLFGPPLLGPSRRDSGAPSSRARSRLDVAPPATSSGRAGGAGRLDPDTSYRALSARDRRFDGLVFVGVRSTGVYCRPVCPARTPARRQCTFFGSAAEAEREGYRACLRCRPELAPGSGPVDAVPRLVRAALARIEAGYLNEASVEDLAGELGVTSRHLRRAVDAELGVTPVGLAQSRRLALAKQLLQDGPLPLAEVAFASGFSSLRRFQALFRARFGRPPSALRRDREPAAAAPGLALRLDYRPPLDWEELLAFLAGRATPGVESVRDGTWRRTVRLGSRAGWVVVARDPLRPALRAEVSLSLAGALMPLAARLHAHFDLDAHPAAVDAHLGRDPLLRGMVRRRPGLRVPGAFDGFEAAARVVLGQQVTVAAATALAGRLAAALGEPVETPFPELRRLAPPAAAVAAAGEGRLARLGLPRARARTLAALGRAVAEGALSLERDGGDAAQAVRAVPGVGDWTAEMIAMRSLGSPDAFPAADLALRRALGGAAARRALARAERWRPWRAYAAQHLWTTLAKGESR